MCRLHSGLLDRCGEGSSSQSSSIRKLNLLDLPSELHLSILSHVDYYDLKALRQTNQYLRNIIEFRQLRHALKRLVPPLLYYANHSAQRNKLACYGCLELLNPTKHFSLAMTTGDFTYAGQFSHNRRCMTCSHTGKSAFIPAQSEHFYFDEGCWIDCNLCRTTRICRVGYLVKYDAGHNQPVCDVCLEQQQQIWPALSTPKKGKYPEQRVLKRATMNLFRRKTDTKIVVSEVTPQRLKGFLRPTESFMNKAKRKIRQRIPRTTAEDVPETSRTSPISRILSFKNLKLPKGRMIVTT